MYPAINIMHGVVDVELTRRCHQAIVLDDLLQPAGLVVHDDEGGFLLLAVPHREPHFVTGLVEFRLHHALGAFAHVGPFGDGQDFIALF